MASLVILRWVASYDHVCVEAIAGPLFKNYSVMLKGPNKTIELKKPPPIWSQSLIIPCKRCIINAF